MIDVRMSQNDSVEGRRIDGRGFPVSQAQILGALKQSAIEQDTPILVSRRNFEPVTVE